ncbi:putative bacteriophage protein [Escherichia coli p0305293.8]|nr:putative bacteriophage protein [Escherichia coli p0305293.8]
MSIPPRDKSVVAVPRPVIDENCAHREQVKNAFDFGFSRYEKAMEELSKV